MLEIKHNAKQTFLNTLIQNMNLNIKKRFSKGYAVLIRRYTAVSDIPVLNNLHSIFFGPTAGNKKQTPRIVQLNTLFHVGTPSLLCKLSLVLFTI